MDERKKGGGWVPTAEQEAIVTAAADRENVVVLAGAGTGKTTAMELVGAALAPRRVLYVAFNSSVAAEARGRMPANVHSSTAHGLAYAALGYQYRARMRAPRRPGGYAAAALDITAPLAVAAKVRLSPASLAALAMRMVKRFCHSADTEIQAAHAASVPGLDRAEHERLAAHLVPVARRAWEDLQLPDGQGGRLRVEHDHYLKVWALTRPVLGYDVIVLDEAQDTNPVLAAVLRGQDAQVIVVGDPAQALYYWRGARNAMEGWPGAVRLPLLDSWRFGPVIAERANTWLAELGTDLRLRGNPARESTVGPIDAPDAALFRSNAGAMGRAMAELGRGRRVALLGGARGVARMAEAARDLRRGRTVQHPDLAGFSSWEQVREYAEQSPEEAGELATFVRLVDEHGPSAILQAAGGMSRQGEAEVVCGTVHRAKGAEWGTVEVGDDFREPRPRQDGTPGPVPAELARVVYVALTRARHCVNDKHVAWIENRTTGKPGRPGRERAPRPGAAPRRTAPRPVQAWPPLDLQATYTYRATDGEPVTVTPKVRDRTTKGGHRLVSVTRLLPLLAHKLAALDREARHEVELMLSGTTLVITDEINDTPNSDSGMHTTRDRGRLITTFQGHPDLTRDDVLDLAEHLRFHLTGEHPPLIGTAPSPPAAEPEIEWPAQGSPGHTTRPELVQEITLYLGHAGQEITGDVDPEVVAEVVMARHGLRRWKSLDDEEVHLALTDARAAD